MPLRIVTTKNTQSKIHQVRCSWFYPLFSGFLMFSLSLVVSLKVNWLICTTEVLKLDNILYIWVLHYITAKRILPALALTYHTCWQ